MVEGVDPWRNVVRTIPWRPVFGWQTFSGRREPGLPCVLDLPNRNYATSGRASILLALEALDVKPGDRVLVPTYHCPTMIAPIVSLGAEPVFYPIGPRGVPLERWLDTAHLEGIKAMLIAHFFGMPQPMARYRRWCDERKIALVEDCAHALFGSSDGQPIGSWGDAAIASLTKFLPVNEGGCLILNRCKNSPVLERVRTLTAIKSALDVIEYGTLHGRLRGLNALVNGTLAFLRRALSFGRSVSGTSVASLGDADDAEMDFGQAHRKMAAPCRWIADSAPRARIVALRRMHYAGYTSAFAGRNRVRGLCPELPSNAAPYVFPLWLDEPEEVYQELRRLQIPVYRWDRLWPGTPSIAGDAGTDWSCHVIQLACHQDLLAAQRERIVDTVLELAR